MLLCVLHGRWLSRQHQKRFTTGYNILINPIPFMIACRREGPSIQAPFCYSTTWEIEPGRKLNQVYFHSTYLLFPPTPLPLQDCQNTFYWLSTECPVLHTRISPSLKFWNVAFWGESREESQVRPVSIKIHALPPSPTICYYRSTQSVVLGPTVLLASCGNLLEILRPYDRPRQRSSSLCFNKWFWYLLKSGFPTQSVPSLPVYFLYLRPCSIFLYFFLVSITENLDIRKSWE